MPSQAIGCYSVIVNLPGRKPLPHEYGDSKREHTEEHPEQAHPCRWFNCPPAATATRVKPQAQKRHTTSDQEIVPYSDYAEDVFDQHADTRRRPKRQEEQRIDVDGPRPSEALRSLGHLMSPLAV